jgi:GntR family transcriptional regulator, transcriptional repressor for pyruvate dehydrogenase complex
MSNENIENYSSSITPIDRAGITELVVQRIKDLLAQGDLKAGSRLPPERELAELLNISRPSLRTALKALSVMGIIRAKPGAGTYIAESLPEIFSEPMHFMTLINNTSVEELFEARRIIEAGLAELAAERASSDDIQSLTSEIEGMRSAIDDPENFLKHDVAFHRVMGHVANNKLMSGIMDTIAQLLFHIRRQSITNASSLKEAIDWHQKILDAIRKHDPKRAKDMLAAHLRAAQESWAQEHRTELEGRKEEKIKAKRK